MSPLSPRNTDLPLSTAVSPSPGPWGEIWVLLTRLPGRGMVGTLAQSGWGRDWPGLALLSSCSELEREVGASLGRTSEEYGEPKHHSRLFPALDAPQHAALLPCSRPSTLPCCLLVLGIPGAWQLKPQGPGQSHAEAILGEGVRPTEEAGQASTPAPSTGHRCCLDWLRPEPSPAWTCWKFVGLDRPRVWV